MAETDSKPASGPPAPTGGVELAPRITVPASAITIKAVRSSGPGGQNVNKVSTKVELRIHASVLPMEGWALARLRDLAGRRMTEDGELMISADEYRSQSRNKDECFARLRQLLLEAMTRPKKRFKTKPTKGSKMRRIDAKKQRSQIKKDRTDRHDD